MGLQYSDENFDQWQAALQSLNFELDRLYRIATEGALLGRLAAHGFNPNLVIVTDNAGQFNILNHALCWIHAERTINKLVGFTNEQIQAVESTRSMIWHLYDKLKAFKDCPTERQKVEIEALFDKNFTQNTCFASLNNALKRIHKNKSELLFVLEFPETPLHNNLSENDLREYVKRRKVSGSTRSNLGRRCRDTFTSLKKTCRKLNVSFWQYLKDRLCLHEMIPFLPDLIALKAQDYFA